LLPPDLIDDARRLIDSLRARHLMLATAESCTGGLIAAAITEVPGASDVLERSFVTYSNAAKIGMLGVDPELLMSFGAVSREAALAMAEGALRNSAAGIAVSVTGIAGPGGGTQTKPVGLVHFGVASRGRPARHRERRFGDPGRTQIRLESVREAFRFLAEEIGVMIDASSDKAPPLQSGGP
jgi:nicotinamide-nucleotide amidase